MLKVLTCALVFLQHIILCCSDLTSIYLKKVEALSITKGSSNVPSSGHELANLSICEFEWFQTSCLNMEIAPSGKFYCKLQFKIVTSIDLECTH